MADEEKPLVTHGAITPTLPVGRKEQLGAVPANTPVAQKPKPDTGAPPTSLPQKPKPPKPIKK